MAAAHVIMLGKLGNSCTPTLPGLIEDEEFLEDLQNKERRGHTAARDYLQQIQNYLWALGQLVSPKQIADEAEARIMEYENISAEDCVNQTKQYLGKEGHDSSQAGWWKGAFQCSRA